MVYLSIDFLDQFIHCYSLCVLAFSCPFLSRRFRLSRFLVFVLYFVLVFFVWFFLSSHFAFLSFFSFVLFIFSFPSLYLLSFLLILVPSFSIFLLSSFPSLRLHSRRLVCSRSAVSYIPLFARVFYPSPSHQPSPSSLYFQLSS